MLSEALFIGARGQGPSAEGWRPKAEGRRLKAEGRGPRVKGRGPRLDGGILSCVMVHLSIQEHRGFIDFGRFRRRLLQYLTSLVKYWIVLDIWDICRFIDRRINRVERYIRSKYILTVVIDSEAIYNQYYNACKIFYYIRQSLNIKANHHS